MSHIEKRYNLYYATLKVPAHLQEKVGRAKFLKSLGTSDRRRAEDLARPYIVLWKKLIRAAERGPDDPLMDEAKTWREGLKASTKPGGYESPEEAHDAAWAMEDQLAERAMELERTKGADVAHQFYEVATGKAELTADHLSAWEASISHLEDKTQDQMKKDARRLCEHFTTVQSIDAKAVRDWIKQVTTGEKALSRSSVTRISSAGRSFWSHLQREDVAPMGVQPFAKVEAYLPATKSTKGLPKGWAPFPSQDIPKLINEARQRDDLELAHLIVLGAHTGARIEELCSLKTEDIGSVSFRIKDAKTEAGIREVPIHADIAALVTKLKDASDDGFLLAGLTLNKYGDRSNAIGKRFGRLKAAMGYGAEHVFHSLRKTLVTMLEDAGVSENLAADIVGHEKPRITYGLYSGGASLQTKAEALARVKYEGLRG